jgi:ComF family protein
MAILNGPRRLLRASVDVVFPRVCHACRSALPPDLSHACHACREALVPVDEWDDAYRDAFRRLTADGSVGEFVAAWYFEREGPLRALMHALKYGGVTSVGREFGRVLGRRVCEAGLGDAGILVPLPLHPSRMRERGFNQCTCIAKGIAEVTGRPVNTGILRRARFTPSQTPLGVAARGENVRGAFALRLGARRFVEGETILLVDDVVTTGATMRSCAGVLSGAGARSVIACAAAIAR